MARFTYKVIVDVPDDSMRPNNEDVAEFWELDADEDGNFSPEILASIVMSERLGPDDNYGFDYRVDWDGPLDPHI